VFELVEWVEKVEKRSLLTACLWAVRIGERTEREWEMAVETGDSRAMFGTKQRQTGSAGRGHGRRTEGKEGKGRRSVALAERWRTVQRSEVGDGQRVVGGCGGEETAKQSGGGGILLGWRW
jgi:hypothetical protein